MPEPLVRYGKRAGVATITLDSPANRNALSARLRRGLVDHLAAAARDDEVRVVVLDHAGPVFCAGKDLKETDPAPAPELPGIILAIWDCPKPVVAALAGPARAGGVGIAAACDVVVAAEPVTFALTEVRLGIVPAVIAAVLRRRVSAPAAHELFLTGATFDAPRAAEIGLVNRVVPGDALVEVTAGYATMLRAGAPGALAETKALLRRGTGCPLADELAELEEIGARSLAGAEAREGVRAFAERRPPQWTVVG
jgi:methylglutaconyl-CoA hydratase